MVNICGCMLLKKRALFEVEYWLAFFNYICIKIKESFYRQEDTKIQGKKQKRNAVICYALLFCEKNVCVPYTFGISCTFDSCYILFESNGTTLTCCHYCIFFFLLLFIFYLSFAFYSYSVRCFMF